MVSNNKNERVELYLRKPSSYMPSTTREYQLRYWSRLDVAVTQRVYSDLNHSHVYHTCRRPELIFKLSGDRVYLIGGSAKYDYLRGWSDSRVHLYDRRVYVGEKIGLDSGGRCT